MVKRRQIREKLLLGGMLVAAVVAVLSASGFVGIYSYRNLVRGLSCRSAELPHASRLGDCVAALRLAHARACAGDEGAARDFLAGLDAVAVALAGYRAELAASDVEDAPLADRSREHDTAKRIAACLVEIDHRVRPAAHEPGGASPTDPDALVALAPELDALAVLTAALPSFLQERLQELAHEVRNRYRSLILTTWASALMAVLLLAAIGVFTYRWVFRPLRLLGHGSRRVAAGDFGYRIRLDSRDEMADLADALNDMTQRFEEIRDDLDRQVQLRTREVIRSEQLASVGFLAAGVAHEINNPLASIAMCAESLEGRLAALGGDDDDARVAHRYLELIQTEAFRCKGITEKLLDFSRLGEVRRQPTAVLSLVKDVAEMLRHVGRFAGRTVEIEDGPDQTVMANPQEFKQVVLNLLVNALDSIEESGRVSVSVRRCFAAAELTFADDGCGMTEEVLEHLFEPFFTRRRTGQGTGLGLSIVQRIVTDHGGRIEAHSDGVGKGATFRLTLPLAEEPRASGPRRSADAAADAEAIRVESRAA